MEQLNKNRSVTLLVLAILFLVLFAVYVYAVKPASSDLNEQEARISTLNQQRTLLQKKLNEKQTQTAASSENEVQSALPLWDNTEQLLLDVQAIEETTGAETLSLAFSGGDDDDSANGDAASAGAGEESAAKGLDPSIKRLKTAAVVKGTYGEVLKYVDALQKLKRLITVDNLDISRSGTDPTAEIQINLAFTAYFDPSYKPLVKETLQPYDN